MSEQVILVNEHDYVVGHEKKMTAHQKGLRHRAFSVFIFNLAQPLQVLLQQRQFNKYHCGGLWTNTCCSHPRPGEDVIVAGERRLHEEMGLKIPLQKAGVFHYVARFDNGLVENEIDHVLVGIWNGQAITVNPTEAADYAWLSLEEIDADLAAERSTRHYTPWFEAALAFARRTPLLKNHDDDNGE